MKTSTIAIITSIAISLIASFGATRSYRRLHPRNRRHPSSSLAVAALFVIAAADYRSVRSPTLQLR